MTAVKIKQVGWVTVPTRLKGESIYTGWCRQCKTTYIGHTLGYCRRNRNVTEGDGLLFRSQNFNVISINHDLPGAA